MKTRFTLRAGLLLFLAFVTAGLPAAALEPIPADLPLSASPPNSAAWLREANMLQPYALSQYVAFINPSNRPASLQRDFGFNAINVLPTDAHNATPELKDPAHHSLTDEQFRAGLAAYRAAGYHLILYNSIQALGLSPDYTSGKVVREHPDWLQRDPQGNPVMVYGTAWLCPSTGARELALERCVHLAREYQPDGIMIDNNQFFFAGAGWTCHCAACTKAFREYARARCGVEGTRKLFGFTPDALPVPSEPGPLFAFWMQWRNRVWADINESFRARLREVNPQIMFFANTQFLFDTGVLATDYQYEREDILVSETVGLNSRQTSEKMVLGNAFAKGRPLWNYIGTFSKGDDYTGLLAATTIGPMIAATLAHAACPWIVDGFDLGPTDPLARKEMSRLLGWHASHEDLYAAAPWAGVATLISTTSRNVFQRPLIPPHLSTLQSGGTPVTALRDENLSAADLAPFHVITIETSPCLDETSARALAQWVRAGGTLLAALDTGNFDELGRQRILSPLWSALDLKTPPLQPAAVGRGKVVARPPEVFARTAVELVQPWSFQVAPETGVEVVAYRQDKSLLLHLVRHRATPTAVVLHFPEELRPAQKPAQLLIPGEKDRTLAFLADTSAATLTIADLPLYSVLKITLR